MENISHILGLQKTTNYELTIKKLQNSHKETSMSKNQKKHKSTVDTQVL